MKDLFTIALGVAGAYVAYRLYQRNSTTTATNTTPCCDGCASGTKPCADASKSPPFVPASSPFEPATPIGLDVQPSLFADRNAPITRPAGGCAS